MPTDAVIGKIGSQKKRLLMRGEPPSSAAIPSLGLAVNHKQPSYLGLSPMDRCICALACCSTTAFESYFLSKIHHLSDLQHLCRCH